MIGRLALARLCVCGGGGRLEKEQGTPQTACTPLAATVCSWHAGVFVFGFKVLIPARIIRGKEWSVVWMFLFLFGVLLERPCSLLLARRLLCR